MPRFGRFDIVSLIGRGGMAEVYRARVVEGDDKGQDVALKRMIPDKASDAEAVGLFTDEAELGKWLQHPNVVRVIESGRLNGTFYLAMELVDGRDLSTILRACRERGILLPVDFGTYLVICILEALAFAHCLFTPEGKLLRLVHCDVTPSNVFISKLGEVKLGDFGVAKARATRPDGPLFGKPAYLPPEVLAGEPVSPGADLWSAACILYELYTNLPPFDGSSAQEIADQAVNGPPDVRVARPDVPDALAEALRTALDPDAGARYGTAELFIEALDAHYDKNIGTPLAIASVVRGLFGSEKT